MLNRFWLFMKRDPLRRLVALAFAVAVYLHLDFEIESYDRTDLPDIKVPVTLSLESGLQPPQEPPQMTVNLRAKSGFEIDMEKLAAKTRVYVSVRKRDHRQDGTYEVKVGPGNIKLPDPRFKVDRIVQPADGKLKLKLLQQGERDLKVEPVWKEAVPPNMELKWEAVPDHVRITGPENIVSAPNLQLIRSTPISLAEAPESFEYDAGLNPPPGVTTTPRKVRFRITLRQKWSRRIMQLPATLLIAPGNDLSAAIVSPPENGVEVTLRGPAAKLAQLAPKQVRFFVDVTEVQAPGRRRLPVRCLVDVPEITPVSIVPAELEVQFTTNTSEINKPRKEK